MTEATPTFDSGRPLTAKALALATEAHAGQKDKGGNPYLHHPIFIANQMATETEIIVALLHDVCEDSPTTLEDLAQAGFPAEVVTAIQAITKVSGEDYLAYLDRVKANPVATKVKLADLAHNSDQSRLGTVTEKYLKRLAKYAVAVAHLTG